MLQKQLQLCLLSHNTHVYTKINWCWCHFPSALTGITHKHCEWTDSSCDWWNDAGTHWDTMCWYSNAVRMSDNFHTAVNVCGEAESLLCPLTPILPRAPVRQQDTESKCERKSASILVMKRGQISSQDGCIALVFCTEVHDLNFKTDSVLIPSGLISQWHYYHCFSQTCTEVRTFFQSASIREHQSLSKLLCASSRTLLTSPRVKCQSELMWASGRIDDVPNMLQIWNWRMKLGSIHKEDADKDFRVFSDQSQP